MSTPRTVPVEYRLVADPSGAGWCPRCHLPIEVHPRDIYGDDVNHCWDQSDSSRRDLGKRLANLANLIAADDRLKAIGEAETLASIFGGYDQVDPENCDHLWYRPRQAGMPFKVCQRCGATQERPQPRDLVGLARGMTGGLPAEEWVRRIRDEAEEE